MSRHIYAPRSECVPQINLLCGCYSVGRLGYGSALLLDVFDIRKAVGVVHSLLLILSCLSAFCHVRTSP